jgi:hypothetical protein
MHKSSGERALIFRTCSCVILHPRFFPCSPPIQPSCQTTCAPPVCDWQCHRPASCPRPKCALVCDQQPSCQGLPAPPLPSPCCPCSASASSILVVPAPTSCCPCAAPFLMPSAQAVVSLPSTQFTTAVAGPPQIVQRAGPILVVSQSSR